MQDVILPFNFHGSVHRKNILIYTQQDATLHSLFYLETALRVSGGTTTHHQERKQLYLQDLVLVTQLLLPAAMCNVASCCIYIRILYLLFTHEVKMYKITQLRT